MKMSTYLSFLAFGILLGFVIFSASVQTIEISAAATVAARETTSAIIDNLERARNIATILAAFFGLIALIVTAFQVYWTRTQARATILLAMDKEYEGEIYRKSRNLIEELNREILDYVAYALADRSIEDRETKSREMFAGHLKELYRLDYKSYLETTKLLGFFETAGYAAKQGYIRKEHIVNLFGGVLITIHRIFAAHIEHLQQRQGTTKKIYENALFLAKLADDVHQKEKRHAR